MPDSYNPGEHIDTFFRTFQEVFYTGCSPQVHGAVATLSANHEPRGKKCACALSQSDGSLFALTSLPMGVRMAADFTGVVDGSRRAFDAVEIDRRTGLPKRNWVRTILGGTEAAVGAAAAGLSAGTSRR